VSDVWQVGGFMWFPPPIKLTATIAESKTICFVLLVTFHNTWSTSQAHLMVDRSTGIKKYQQRNLFKQ
jgi:hypothetical protein